MRLTVTTAMALVLSLAMASAVAAPASAEITGFRDVPANHEFHDEITWMVEDNITTGYVNENRFKPSEQVTRQAFAAFLYRLEGQPKVDLPSSSPFKDVPTNHPFYKEVVWLSQQEITTGYSDGTFRPQSNISRHAIAAFLFRSEAPSEFVPPETSPFADVPTDYPFYEQITWLHEMGMASGYSDGTYRPARGTSRQATAAFLFRMFAPEDYEVPSLIYRPGEVLRVAKGEVGYTERSWRQNKYNDWIGANNAWCQVYIAWVFDRAGYKDMVPKDSSFPRFLSTMENSGVLNHNPKRSDIRPGTIVFYDWNGNGVASHVGIADRVGGNGLIYAYEGNTSNGLNDGDNTRGVFYRSREFKYVVSTFEPFDYYQATK